MTRGEPHPGPNPKKLLIISYFFPPLRAAGTTRVHGLATYLNARGWEVSVITVAASPDLTSDRATLNNLPVEIKVLRTRSFEIGWVLRRFRGLATPGVGKGPARKTSSAPALRWILTSPLRAFYRVCSFPDSRVGWFLPLLFATWRAIRTERYPVVLSSSPPHSSQLAPAFLKAVCSFRWVADFRDGWTASPYRGTRTGLRARLARGTEAFVLRRCDKVIANTEGNKRALLGTFPFLAEEKVAVITNGFDTKAPLKNVVIRDDETNCDVMHLGAIYPEVAGVLVSSLSCMKKKYPGRVPRVFIYGPMTDGILSRFEEANLSDCVFYKGWVSWDHSIHLMRKARSLLLLLPQTEGGRTTIPGKLYAYLFSGRPIILIAPSGDATTLVEVTQAGVSIVDSDPERIADQLMTIIDSIRHGTCVRPLDEGILQPYTMETVVAKLDGVLTDEI